MSSGIAAEGMRLYNLDKPMPLLVQALDHAIGYLIAANVVRSITEWPSEPDPCTAFVGARRQAAD
jgi:hypothetical protein